ncbi:Uncharacterized protein QTN25_002978 [Entamoeba marina]
MNFDESSDNEIAEWEMALLRSGMLGDSKIQGIDDIRQIHNTTNPTTLDDVLRLLNKKQQKNQSTVESSKKQINICIEDIEEKKLYLEEIKKQMNILKDIKQRLANFNNIPHDSSLSNEEKEKQLQIIANEVNNFPPRQQYE